MSTQKDPNAGASRDQARARLRTVTSAALLATTGATVGIAIVVAHEHPGKSAATTTSGQSTGGTTGATGSSGNTGDTGGSTGNTGNSGGSSFSPSISSQSPSVTSGGSHR
ncbi:MAG TPA: hypothetical protein VMP41_15985 [Acidimicrobiales bacterium]|nr:hypothetical protein [Acidimicrobiales bacterium]